MGKYMRKEERQNQVRRHIAFLFIIAAVVLAGVVLVRKYMPSREKMDAETYFTQAMSSDGTQAELKENELAVVLNDKIIPQKARLDGENLYLSYELVRDYLNERFYWDEGNSQIIFTTPLQTYEIPVNSTGYTIDGEDQTFDTKIIVSDSDDLWMSAAFVQQYTNVEYTVEAETKHVLITSKWGTKTTATVEKSAAVRFQGGIKSPILTEAPKGSSVLVLEQLDQWSRVVTADGFIGYIRNSRISAPEETEVTRDFDEPDYTSITSDEKIVLGWHMVSNSDSNDYLDNVTEKADGMNVISPTWFSLTDNEGNFSSLADKDYVKKAHKKGLQVWALIDNFSADMSTATLMSSTNARRTLADNLIRAAREYDLDGINIDFETIKEEARYSYVQFMRELSILCRKNKIVLSVDVPVTFDFNTYYNRKELGTVCDYVIMMGYDEHYYGSEAGSVASLSFEEGGIQKGLEEVNASKFISAVPFYTRLWFTSDTAGAITDSQTLTMSEVNNTMRSWKVAPTWNGETMQNFVTWDANGTTCSIWIEDKYSLALKANLVSKYNLGGIAAWCLSNETDDVWQSIADGLNGNVNQEDVIAQAKAADEQLAAQEQSESQTETEAQAEAVTEDMTEAESAAEPESARAEESNGRTESSKADGTDSQTAGAKTQTAKTAS